MSFTLFMLLYIVVAIALLAVIGVILRNFRRKRQEKAQSPRTQEGAGERRAPKTKLAATAVPEPETPPPPRRRQLQSFATAEKAASETPTVADTIAAPTADDGDYAQAVLGRLENAFDRLQADAITLDAYRAEVLAEQAAIEQRIAALRPGGDGPEMDAALAAQESARWCLDWADEQARHD